MLKTIYWGVTEMADYQAQVDALLANHSLGTQAELEAAQRAVIKFAVDSADMTSGYLLKHNPQTGISTLLLNYISSRARPLERTSEDVGDDWDEHDYPLVLAWLQLPNPPIREKHRDEFDLSHPEIQELVQFGIQSALNIPVMGDGKLWGYAELWESRYRRYFEMDVLDAVACIIDNIPTRTA